MLPSARHIIKIHNECCAVHGTRALDTLDSFNWRCQITAYLASFLILRYTYKHT